MTYPRPHLISCIGGARTLQLLNQDLQMGDSITAFISLFNLMFLKVRQCFISGSPKK